MKALSMTWGIGGVIFLLVFAIVRLTPMALELEHSPMSAFHWLALIFSVVYMAYAEGYKGFHLAFAPRVVARARHLANNPRPLHVLLAPLYCMGFIHATRRRKIISFALTTMIICFVMIARILPQPWRGIVDAGVVVGLGVGVASIFYFLILSSNHPDRLTVSPEVPESS